MKHINLTQWAALVSLLTAYALCIYIECETNIYEVLCGLQASGIGTSAEKIYILCYLGLLRTLLGRYYLARSASTLTISGISSLRLEPEGSHPSRSLAREAFITALVPHRMDP